MRIDTILHATDFSANARHALRLATALARAHAARLHVYHAASPRSACRSDRTDSLAASLDRARELLAAPGGSSAVTVTGSESPAEAPFEGIRDAVSRVGADLVVIGSHGNARFDRLLMGSTAERVLHHVPCHVLMTQTGAPIPSDGEFQTLLVPVDFSTASTRCLSAALSLRANRGGEIRLVHVVQPVPAVYLPGSVESFFELEADLGQRIRQNLRGWAGDIPDSTTVVVEGNPALEIARLAETVGAGIIVMSTSGRSGGDRPLVGSVTERVCRVARVPVFVAR